MSDFDFTEVMCPLCPEPSEQLFLEYSVQYGISVGDLASPHEEMSPAESHTQSWSVRCVAGHVLLLPDDIRDCCDEPEGPACTHDPDARDHHEEFRVFRASDWGRLVALLAALGRGQEGDEQR